MREPTAEVLVTVGMGRFPFDRLLAAVVPLCDGWRVVAQTGTSTVDLPCPHQPFLPADELASLLAEVPIVVTHAGNTVRLVQRLGKVPIVVPRRASHGEMADDHQVAYVESERGYGRVIVAEPEPDALRQAVETHAERAAAVLARWPLPPAVPASVVADRLDEIVGPLVARHRRRRQRSALVALPGRRRCEPAP